MTLIKCPHCSGKYRSRFPKPVWMNFLDDEKALTYGLSRRDNKTKICTVCSKAEALADMTGITDGMARTVVGNDHQEALRLPEGSTHGTFPLPTGGLDEYFETWLKVYKEYA